MTHGLYQPLRRRPKASIRPGRGRHRPYRRAARRTLRLRFRHRSLALGKNGLSVGEIGRAEMGVDLHRLPGIGQGLTRQGLGGRPVLTGAGLRLRVRWP